MVAFSFFARGCGSGLVVIWEGGSLLDSCSGRGCSLLTVSLLCDGLSSLHAERCGSERSCDDGDGCISLQGDKERCGSLQDGGAGSL